MISQKSNNNNSINKKFLTNVKKISLKKVKVLEVVNCLHQSIHLQDL